MKAMHMITWILLIIGGLNWGLTGLGFNVVEKIFGSGTTVTVVIYILVGLSALWELFTHWGHCRYCGKEAAMAKTM